jgi:hypothetical protein
MVDVGGYPISPRYYMDAVPARSLFRRQTLCDTGQHSCRELGPQGESVCCPDSQYCLFTREWAIRCCAIGLLCENPCPSPELYLVNETSSSVTRFTRTQPTGLPIVEPSTLFSTTTACKTSMCTGSQFLCPTQFGALCCPMGAACLSGGACRIPESTAPPTVVPTQSECRNAVSQTPCAGGGGCCSIGQTCTVVSSSSVCAGTPAPPSAPPNSTIVTENGLSDGAKAGIGVGVVVAVALILAPLTWFCVRQRREKRRSEMARSRQASQPTPGPGGEMSEVSGPSAARPPLHQSGLTYDYFGPNAVDGPFTTRLDQQAAQQPTRRETGVPANPENPNDIRRPVELPTQKKGPIDARDQAHAHVHAPVIDVQSPTSAGVPETPMTAYVDAHEGPYELDAGPGGPSPLSGGSAASPPPGSDVVSTFSGTSPPAEPGRFRQQ